MEYQKGSYQMLEFSHQNCRDDYHQALQLIEDINGGPNAKRDWDEMRARWATAGRYIWMLSHLLD